MAKELRRQEPNLCAPYIDAPKIMLSNDASFEGADALWIESGRILIGVGKRTNMKAYDEISYFFNNLKVDCITIDTKIPTQHLLGILQIVDNNLAFVRDKYCPKKLIKYLEQHFFKVVRVPESDEIINKQALNIVTIKPKVILIPSDCPNTRLLFESHGIKVLTSEISEIRKGVGGIACATGILKRKIIKRVK
jgi:N-dimethylarginine dimethylaminohydrolase